MTEPAPGRSHLLALFALSAAVLAFEVLLLRLFEFSHWHHFAGLAVSLALLGLGTAGTVLAVLGEPPVRWGDGWFLGAMAAMAAGLVGVVLLHAVVALRPAVAAWDPGELARLLLVDFTAFLPFFAGGLAIGQAFSRWPTRPGAVYAANLLGSGAGSLAASGLLLGLSAPAALAVVAVALALAGTAVAAAQRRRGPGIACALAAALSAPIVLAPPPAAVSDFKALSRLRDLPGARTLAVEPGLPGRFTLMRADSLRFAPGLSLSWTGAVPVMDAAVLGSDRVVPVARRYPLTSGHGRASLAGLPLALRPSGSALVLGTSEWQTPAFTADRPLTWVEPDGRLLRLFRERGIAGRLVEDGLYRHLASDRTRYTVISLDGAFAGGDAATEDYLMTTAGIAHTLERLRPDGVLAIPLAVSYPPRDFPRAMATVAAALDRIGVAAPADHVAAVRGLQAALMLVRPTPLSAGDQSTVRRYAERWGFDLVWLPGMSRDRANRRHVLDSPAFHDSARALLTGGALPPATRWFATAPATLDRPYFWRSLRWDRVGHLIRTQGPRAMSYLDWTLLLGVATTAVATLLGAVLIVLPLGRLPRAEPPLGRPSVVAYFAALGLGYLLVELAVFQRSILLVGEPVVAASVVFALFLLGSGVGSAVAPVARDGRTAARVYLPIAACAAVAGLALWPLTGHLLAPDIGGRLALLGAVTLPLTLAMGRPFPWGLRQLAGHRRLVTWAWGINGFASVVAASLAPLTSVHFGQTRTLGLGLLCYVLAAAIAWRWCAVGGAGREAVEPARR